MHGKIYLFDRDILHYGDEGQAWEVINLIAASRNEIQKLF